MSDEPERVLVTPGRAGAADFPWGDEIIGACTALRGGKLLSSPAVRFMISILALPIVLIDISNFPGTKRMLARLSPIGQLAYGPEVAIAGFQYTPASGEKVRVDWTESPRNVALVSEGWLLTRIRVNERDIYVDRRCGSALVRYWQ